MDDTHDYMSAEKKAAFRSTIRSKIGIGLRETLPTAASLVVLPFATITSARKLLPKARDVLTAAEDGALYLNARYGNNESGAQPPIASWKRAAGPLVAFMAVHPVLSQYAGLLNEVVQEATRVGDLGWVLSRGSEYSHNAATSFVKTALTVNVPATLYEGARAVRNRFTGNQEAPEALEAKLT